jgi:signal transduction histidine kinase/ActR/RegA family two-component response regulator
VSADEALLTNVVDHLALGVWIARAPGGELVFANRVFNEIMGAEARSDVAAGGYAKPYGICDRSGAPYPEQLMPFARAMAAGNTVVVDDIVIHRTDGRRVDIRATARPIRVESDEITHVVISFEDITEQRKAEQELLLADAARREAQRLESLGTLSAGVAHDFNNVLASISMIASRLRLREDDAHRASDLRHIEAAVDSAAQLTRALLAFGRERTGRTSRFDAGSIVASVVALVRRTFDRSIEVRFEVTKSAWLLGDPSHIEQAFLNLAVNARDAMPQGGVLTIVVDTLDVADLPPHLAPGRYVRISVSDTGPGVPDAIRHRIFEPYFTTKNEPERPGTGLGLATVYGVAQAFGGFVQVGSAQPTGAVFLLFLPVASGPVTVDRVAPPIEIERGEGKVLLIEDEPMLRQATRRSLELIGYDVVEASDGRQGLERFVELESELVVVLLDAIMPKLGGRGVLAELRRLGSRVPVVLASGRIGPGEQDELVAAGAASVLHKPFTTAELSRAIAAARATASAAPPAAPSAPRTPPR